MHGEFIRGDGLVIPNNFTLYGCRVILAAALRNEVPRFFVGLCDGAPDESLTTAQLDEPQRLNGYSRIEVSRDAVGWETEGNVNGEPFFETKFLSWAATDAGFSIPIRRMFLVDQAVNEAPIQVMALSVALGQELTIKPDTPEEQRRFKYRLYAR